jgi:peptide deformylase
MAERQRKPVPFQVLINPEIVSLSEELKVFFEGCLSVAGFCALVPRSSILQVSYLDQHGSPHSLEARGWHARIIQHEVDHLQGTLYIDRMLSRTFTSLDNLAQYWKGEPAKRVMERLK